jgi:membrane fusion protein
MTGPDQKNSLFRPEALNAQRATSHGEIVLVRPLSLSFLTVLAALMAAGILTFLFCFSYSRKITVTGQLMPQAGLIKIYVPQPGIVVARHVAEGQPVRKGDVLYELSSDRHASATHGTQALISEQVRQREQSLHDSADKTRRVQAGERQSLNQKAQGLTVQAAVLQDQVKGQRARVELARDAASRYEGLLEQGYISRDQVQARQADLLDQQQRMQSLLRERSNVQMELHAVQRELTTLAPRQQNQLGEIERALTAVRQELTESESKRRFMVIAPEAGIATVLMAQPGQSVDAATPLVSIVPAGSQLQAELYVPARAAGFITPNATVQLRYQAFPYQKFGKHSGTIATVARTALSPNELSGIRGAIPNQGSPQPYYRAIAHIERQAVTAYGKPVALQAGMEFEADVPQETRKLYEWVLEPLYTLTGKV